MAPKRAKAHSSTPPRDVMVFDKYCEGAYSNDHRQHFIDFERLDDSDIQRLTSEMELYEDVKNIMGLSVRLKVKLTSKKRKGFKTKNDLAVQEGTNEITYGSGTAIWSEKDKAIQVLTAKHLVFNKHEARDAKCYFNYDQNWRENGRIARGNKEKISTPYFEKDDMSIFQINSSDLTKELEHLIKKNSKSLNNFSKKSRIFTEKAFRKKYIMISHPHGCRTYASMGDAHTFEKEENTFISYNEKQCSGSSGGIILTPGKGIYVHSASDEKQGVSSVVFPSVLFFEDKDSLT